MKPKHLGFFSPVPPQLWLNDKWGCLPVPTFWGNMDPGEQNAERDTCLPGDGPGTSHRPLSAAPHPGGDARRPAEMHTPRSPFLRDGIPLLPIRSPRGERRELFFFSLHLNTNIYKFIYICVLQGVHSYDTA